MPDIKFSPPWEGPPVSFEKVERNPHGSVTLTPFMVKSIDRTKTTPLVGMVDTGSIYTSIPQTVASELGLVYLGSVPISLLDGRVITANMFGGLIEIEGREIATTFSSVGDGATVIGVTDLEKLGFKVNPLTGKLEPTKIFG